MKIMRIKQQDGTTVDIPVGITTTKVSQLENDMGYQTESEVDSAISSASISTS